MRAQFILQILGVSPSYFEPTKLEYNVVQSWLNLGTVLYLVRTQNIDTNTLASDNAKLITCNQYIFEKTMANTLSAAKRARQAEKRRIHNASQRSNLRTYIKKVIALTGSGDATKAQAAYKQAVPVIDAAVNKGLVHKNKAARDKSRLNARVKNL